MGTAQDKSHPLTKLLTTTSKKWPWARKMWKALAQRTSLNSIFFSTPAYTLLSSFFRKKIEFCQDDINFGKQRDFWEDTTNLELSTKMQTLRSLVQEFLLRTAGILFKEPTEHLMRQRTLKYNCLQVGTLMKRKKIYEGLGINKDLLQREALLTDTLVRRDL